MIKWNFKFRSTMMVKQIIYFVVFILFINIQIVISTDSEPDYYRYLQQFGYTPKVEGRRLFSVVSKASYNDGIKTLQRLYKLPETGELDEKTKQLMQRSRCGNPDVGTVNTVKRPINVDKPEPKPQNRGRAGQAESAQTYVTQWPKKELKWFIEEYPKQQKLFQEKSNVDRIIQQALHDWEKYSGLKFEKARDSKSADLKFKFNSRDHGDGYPFDGQGTTLAHAFYPTVGDIHFDDDERFTDDYKNPYGQYTLRLVAAHEIGHALGLSHSYNEQSIMYPLYQEFTSNYNISDSDKNIIQKLYGEPDKTTIKPTGRTTWPRKRTTIGPTKNPVLLPTAPGRLSDSLPIDNWCAGKFDTACEGPDGELYVFKYDQVWRYRAKTTGSWDPKPTRIDERFPSLTDVKTSACVKSTTGYTYLFQNYGMWRLKTHWSGDGPHILHGKGYPQNPHVALLHQNSIYLILDDLVYRLDENDYGKELESRPIDGILKPPPAVGEYIRSGFTYDKHHYIFTKNHVYVYDSTSGQLLSGYPKPATNGWFACEKASGASDSAKQTPAAYRNNNERENHDEHHHHHHHPPPQKHRHHHHY